MKKLKVLLVIDSLGSGGAQRQLVNLAKGLKNLGVVVEVLVYYPKYDFFRKEILGSGIILHEIVKKKKISFKVIKKIKSLYKGNKYNVIISFLETPSIYCEIAKIAFFLKFRLIVCERSSVNKYSISWLTNIKRLLHVFSNAIVANSYYQGKWLSNKFYLKNKVSIIYNGYNFSNIQIGSREETKVGEQFSYLVVGRIAHYKNGLGLLNALVHYVSSMGKCPVINWAGRLEKDKASVKIYDTIEATLDSFPIIKKNWNWLGEVKDLSTQFHSCDALLHLSFFEGLPNAICEAFIHGRPVIASNVCEHPKLVEEGVRGFLCDPHSASSIFRSIMKFEKLSIKKRRIIGSNAHRYASENLGLSLMVRKYLSLIKKII